MSQPIPTDRWSVYAQPHRGLWVEVHPALALEVGDRGPIPTAAPGTYVRVTGGRWAWIARHFASQPWAQAVRAALVEFSGADRVEQAERLPPVAC